VQAIGRTGRGSPAVTTPGQCKERAEKYLYEMLSAGLAGDCYVYNIVIDSCAKAGDLHRAEGWMSKMKTAGEVANVVMVSLL